MFHTRALGGTELRKIKRNQFESASHEKEGYHWIFKPMLQGSFKNYTGSVKDYKKTRKNIQNFNEANLSDCFNPYKVIDVYLFLLPRGWIDKGKDNPLFLTPKTKVTNGVGFKTTPRGRNVTSKFLERAMQRLGITGKFTNTQIGAQQSPVLWKQGCETMKFALLRCIVVRPLSILIRTPV